MKLPFGSFSMPPEERASGAALHQRPAGPNAGGDRCRGVPGASVSDRRWGRLPENQSFLFLLIFSFFGVPIVFY